MNAAAGADKALITDVRVFDEFIGGSLGEGKKSLAITVRLQPTDKTLTEEDIDAVGKAIAQLLTTESAARDRLTAGVYMSDTDDASGRVHQAFHLVLTAARAESAIRNALKEPVTFENHEELVRKAVESAQLVRADNKEPLGQITISAGVATFQAGEDVMEFVNRADQALYRSKREGRNRVSVA